MRTKIFHVVFKTNKEYFCTNRTSLRRVVEKEMSKIVNMGTIDNYIQKKNWLPTNIIYLESYDTYDFLNDVAQKHYSEGLNNLCSKSIQRKYTELIKVLCDDPNSSMVM